MNKHKILVAWMGCLAVVLLTVSSFAAEIAATDFVDDGGDGTIAGDTSGSGWAAAGWTVEDPAIAGALVPTSMSYNVPGGGTVTADTAVQFLGPGLSQAVQRSLAAPVNSDDVYISFLTGWESGTITSNDFVIWYFNDRDGPNIGYKADQGTAGGTLEGEARLDFVGRTAGSTNEYAEDQLVVGETYFMVGHLSKTAPGAANPYDRYELWVNPAFGDSGSPESISSGAANISEFTDVGVRTHQIDFATEQDDLRFGALRIGTTWGDVVPVPEPSTFVLALLGIVGLLHWRRRSSAAETAIGPRP